MPARFAQAGLGGHRGEQNLVRRNPLKLIGLRQFLTSPEEKP